MKRQRLTEAEERRMAEAMTAEARAPGFTGKDRMPPVRGIYHNTRYRYRPGRVRRERGGSQVKPATNHPINRPDRDG